ncbi:hypothetical protein ACWEVP_23500 [Amycolatopsis sp. NPDC003865]
MLQVTVAACTPLVLLLAVELLNDALKQRSRETGSETAGVGSETHGTAVDATVRSSQASNELIAVEFGEDLADLDLLFHGGPLSDETEHILVIEDPYLVMASSGELPADRCLRGSWPGGRGGWLGREPVTSPDWRRPSRTRARSRALCSGRRAARRSCRWFAPGRGSPFYPDWRFTTVPAAPVA